MSDRGKNGADGLPDLANGVVVARCLECVQFFVANGTDGREIDLAHDRRSGNAVVFDDPVQETRECRWIIALSAQSGAQRPTARTCPPLCRGLLSAPPLALEVEPYNEERLLVAYEAIMQEARYALAHSPGSWRGLDFLDIATPIRTILWATGPEAVPYQMELVYDPETGFTFWPPATVHTWDNIARYATDEQVAYLVDIAKKPAFRKEPYQESSRRYAPGLVWALRQLHENGSERMKELTREVVQVLPETDLCPRSMEIGVPPYGKG